jgi:flagellar biosynthesis protein FlhB
MKFGTEPWWNDADKRKPKKSEKNCPSATLCITNPTWTEPGAKPDLRGKRPATNRLSHGIASFHIAVSCCDTLIYFMLVYNVIYFLLIETARLRRELCYERPGFLLTPVFHQAFVLLAVMFFMCITLAVGEEMLYKLYLWAEQVLLISSYNKCCKYLGPHLSPYYDQLS